MLYPILLSIVVTLNTFLALFILAKNHRNHINLSFASFIFFVVAWIIINYLSNSFQDIRLALFFNKAIFVISPYIFLSLVYFSLVFPKKIINVSLKKTLSLLLIPVLVANVITFYNLVITGITFLPVGGTGVIFGPGIYFIVVLFISYLLLSVFFLIKSYLRSRSFERLQLQHLLLGISLAMVLGVLLNLVIPVIFNSFTASNYGPFSSIAIVFFTAYAILRHKLLDIRLILARTVAYSVIIFIVATVYTGIVFYISNSLLNSNLQVMQIVIFAFLTLFVALTYQPLKQFIEQITDKIFFKNKYDSEDLLARLTKIMATTINLEDLTRGTLHDLLLTMHITRGSFIIFQQNGMYPAIIEGFDSHAEFPLDKILPLSKNLKIMQLDDEDDETMKQLMRDLNISITLPMHGSNKFHGMLLLGEKKSGEMFSSQDLDVLGIFSSEVAVAIENAKSFEEIKRFNITLKSEVEKATTDLKSANERLKELDKLKDEFVSLASHELRTPMTAVKSYLLLLKDNNSLDDKGKVYMQHAYEATTRLINLVNDMLNVSRIESGRMVLNMETVDINKLIDDVINEILPAAQKQGINLLFVKPEEVFPSVQIDADKIKEVLINLIGNSVKFTPIGGIIKVSLSHKNGMVAVSVTDNGKGIKPEDKDKLFKKFSMIEKNYAPGTAKQGTGLGLYINKNIIELHGGTIEVASDGENKGSTFTFTLRPVFLHAPIAQPTQLVTN